MEKILIVLDVLIKKTFYRKRLKAYEAFCIEIWKKTCDLETSEIIEYQIKNMSFAIRYHKDKVVGIGYLKGFSSRTFSSEYLFVYQNTDEVNAFTIHFKKGRKKIRANIFVSEGQLSALVFSKAPAEFFSNPEDISVDKTVTNINLAKKHLYKKRKSKQELHGWVSEIIGILSPEFLYEPHSKEYIDSKVINYNSPFPKEYINVNLHVNGVDSKEKKIFGIDEVFTITHPKDNFIVIMEIFDEGYIALREGNSSPYLYLIEHDVPDSPKKLSISFREIIEAQSIMEIS